MNGQRQALENRLHTGRWALLWFASTLLTAMPVGAQPNAAPEQVLDRVCDWFKAQKAFRVEVDTAYDDVLEDGQKVQYSAFQQLSVQKPDRLRSDYVGDERVTEFYYDGKSFALLSPQKKLYVTRLAPATIDQAVDTIAEKYGITIPLSNLAVADPCTRLRSDLLTGTFVGNDMVNRVTGSHFLFSGSERDWQLWVSDGEKPLPMKLVITYKKLPGAPQYTAVFSNWDFAPGFSEEAFAFKPPAGAYGIEFLPPESAQNAPQKRGKKL